MRPGAMEVSSVAVNVGLVRYARKTYCVNAHLFHTCLLLGCTMLCQLFFMCCMLNPYPLSLTPLYPFYQWLPKSPHAV